MSIDGGDGEPVDRYDESVRRAAKAHKCDACRETIKRGDLYHRTAMLFEGQWDITNRCARCEAMYRFLQPCVRKLGDGDEICDPELQCGHVWSDNFEGEPPLVVQALAFLTPAEAQVLLSKRARFERRVSGSWGSANVAGPIESEDARIARLLRTILGDRFPSPAEGFVPVEREGREAPNGW